MASLMCRSILSGYSSLAKSMSDLNKKFDSGSIGDLVYVLEIQIFTLTSEYL